MSGPVLVGSTGSVRGACDSCLQLNKGRVKKRLESATQCSGLAHNQGRRHRFPRLRPRPSRSQAGRTQCGMESWEKRLAPHGELHWLWGFPVVGGSGSVGWSRVREARQEGPDMSAAQTWRDAGSPCPMYEQHILCDGRVGGLAGITQKGAGKRRQTPCMPSFKAALDHPGPSIRQACRDPGGCP